MRRVERSGERGSGEWERVSWDDALDDIAQRLADLRERYGSGTLASMIGGLLYDRAGVAATLWVSCALCIAGSVVALIGTRKPQQR